MSRRPPSFWELAVEATTNTRQGYNLLAPHFDQTAYATPPELIEVCRQRVDRLYPVEPESSRAADLACGTGQALLSLRRGCARVDGYDFSPGMLQQAAQRVARTGQAESFTLLEADLAAVELPEQAYDRIVTFGAWGHILPRWRQRLMEQIVAALKLGGVFYTVTADPSGTCHLDWWKAALFDTAIKVRNRLLGNPFHMYYLLNDTLTVKRLLEETGGCQVRLEPLPRWPHPRLTLLLAVKRPADGFQEPRTGRRSMPGKPAPERP